MRLRWLLALIPVGAIAVGAAGIAAPDPSRGVEAEVTPLVARCAFCHGTDGQSRNPIWPNLAGLDANYVAAQLDGFARGTDGPRRTPHASQMYGLSRWLDDEERRAVAAHYAAMPAARLDADGEPSAGQKFYAEGSAEVAACAGCHGADATGVAELGAPLLAGQQPRYIAHQLRAYAAGTRDDGGSGMAGIAQAMSDDQIAAVASYLGNTEGTDQ